MCRIVAVLLAAVAVAVGACGDPGRRSSVASTSGAPQARTPDSSRHTGASAGTTAAAGSRSASGDWPTYHRQSARTGADIRGPATGKVRRLWTEAVDGAVYAEPLVAGGRVIVATESDTVYAFDAASGRPAWHAHLGTPVAGGDLPCGNIDPSGITSTPVVDPHAGLIYVVAFQRGFRHSLIALDLATGRVRWRRPIDPPGADPRVHQQRSALALSRGRVYVAYGGLFGDCGNYHGWVVGAPASGATGGVVSYRVPTGREGAIWASSGPAVDAGGNLYVATGNGSSTTSFDFGNAVIRLTANLREAAFFAPSNAPALSADDLDLGSTGVLLLPDARAFIIGKTGVGYLLDTRRLGGLGHPLASRTVCDAAFGGDAYAGGLIYVPCTSGIVAVSPAGDSLREVWRQGAATLSPIVGAGAVWAIGGSTLYQLDARTGRVHFSASIGDAAPFASPTAAGGRIFVAGGGRVQAFG
jgi:outer membrane protein assembly factor BamB